MNNTELLQARYRDSRWEDGCYPQRLRHIARDRKPETKPGRSTQIPVDIREEIKRITKEASTFPLDEVWHPVEP